MAYHSSVLKGRGITVAQENKAHCRLAFEAVLGIPFTGGNRIDVLRNGCRIFPAMLDAIANAGRSIEFLTFIYWTGDIAERFARALADRARAGVEVRVLLDSFGAASMPSEYIELMEAAGIEVRWFRPLANWKIWANDNRTHRKILVVDGATGFTGGVGIAEEWEGDARNEREWRDTHFRILGPAVLGLQAAFYGNWMESGGLVVDALDTVIPPNTAGTARIQVLRATAAVGWSDIASLLQTIISLAQVSLRFVTPYLAPDDASTQLLIDAANRGVRIEMIIPGPHTDKRMSELAGASQWDMLMDAGIIIWKYQPTMIHAKIVTMDGTFACIGSLNFNHRSALKDDEIALVTDCGDTVATLDQHFDEDLRSCERLAAGSWRNRGLIRRSIEFLARVVKQQV